MKTEAVQIAFDSLFAMREAFALFGLMTNKYDADSTSLKPSPERRGLLIA